MVKAIKGSGACAICVSVFMGGELPGDASCVDPSLGCGWTLCDCCNCGCGGRRCCYLNDFVPSTFLTTLVLQALAERQRALVMQGRASVRGTAIRELAAELGPGIVLYFQMTKELGFVMLAISCMSIPSLVLALSVRSAAGSPRRANTACTECIAYIILSVYFAHVHTESDAHTLACLHTHTRPSAQAHINHCA